MKLQKFLLHCIDIRGSIDKMFKIKEEQVLRCTLWVSVSFSQKSLFFNDW